MRKLVRVQPLTQSQAETKAADSPKEKETRRQRWDAQGESHTASNAAEDTPLDPKPPVAESPSHSVDSGEYRTVPMPCKSPEPTTLLTPATATTAHHHYTSSQDALLSGETHASVKAKDFPLFPTFSIESEKITQKNTDGLKHWESVTTDALGSKETQRRYAPGIVSDSARARSALLNSARGLEARQVIVEMAASVPRDYPLLDLSEKCLNDENLPQIGKLLDVYPFAVSLDLFGNRLTFSSPEYAPDNRPHSTLSTLMLSHNPLGPLPPHTSLNRLIASLPRLRTVELADCGLTDGDFLRLGPHLVALSALQVLDLSGNFLSDESYAVAIQMLTSSAEIRIIDLRRTRVGARFAQMPSSLRSRVLFDRSKRCCPHCVIT